MSQHTQNANANRKTVMISSTARDLPDHRREVLDACLRQGMFPIMMEHLPSSDSDAISESLNMVDQADIYLGIFAHRYGHIPKGHDISITEMEYNRAFERGIPRLIFIMDKTHPIQIDDVEMGEGATKLKAFKERLLAENIVNTFKSPDDLRAHVINSLSKYRQPDLTAFHYVSDIPIPPEPYIAHPYTLLQTPNLIGRQVELNLLTDWVTKPASEIYWARILNIVAIGGMAKALSRGNGSTTLLRTKCSPLQVASGGASTKAMPPSKTSSSAPLPTLQNNPKKTSRNSHRQNAKTNCSPSSIANHSC